MFGSVTQSLLRSAHWADKSLTSLSAGSLTAMFPLELSQEQKNEKSEIYNPNFSQNALGLGHGTGLCSCAGIRWEVIMPSKVCTRHFAVI